MADLTVVVWAWRPRGRRGHKGRIVYGPALANMQAKAISKNLRIPHEIVCVSDYPTHEFDSSIRVVDATEHFNDHADVGGCYRRLKMYAPEMKELLGPRIVSMDLDMVVVKDLTPLFETWYPFRIWKSDSLSGQPYNGSLQAHTAGENAHIWKDFDINRTPNAARMEGFRGTDQACIAYMMGRSQPVWTWQDGVMYLARNCGKLAAPEIARVIFSPGGAKVTDPVVQARFPWLKPLLEQDVGPSETPPWSVGEWTKRHPDDKPKFFRPPWRKMLEIRQQQRTQAIKERQGRR
jgi:hypothetical protein